MVRFHYRSSSKYVLLNDVESIVRLVCSNCTYFDNYNSQLFWTDMLLAFDISVWFQHRCQCSMPEEQRVEGGAISTRTDGKIVLVSPA